MTGYSLIIVLPILFHGSPVLIHGAAAPETTADYCYDVQSDFAQLCTKFDGVIDGPRCFFALPQQVKSWEDAWAACKANGAALAQFHTESELNKFKALIKYKYPKYGGDSNCPHCGIIMAYYGKVITTNIPFTTAITTRNINWYNDVDSYQPNLNLQNTLAKYYDCDTCTRCSDCSDSSIVLQGTKQMCYSLSYYDDVCVNGYAGCGYWYPSCVVSNSVQAYTQTAYCLTETPIDSVCAEDVQACTNECRARSGWCRSVNLVRDADGTRCDLFSRSIKDCDTDAAKCPSKTPKTAACVHYNYEP